MPLPLVFELSSLLLSSEDLSQTFSNILLSFSIHLLSDSYHVLSDTGSLSFVHYLKILSVAILIASFPLPI